MTKEMIAFIDSIPKVRKLEQFLLEEIEPEALTRAQGLDQMCALEGKCGTLG